MVLGLRTGSALVDVRGAVWVSWVGSTGSLARTGGSGEEGGSGKEGSKGVRVGVEGLAFPRPILTLPIWREARTFR